MSKEQQYRNVVLGKMDPLKADEGVLWRVKSQSSEGSNARQRAEDGLQYKHERRPVRWQKIGVMVAIIGAVAAFVYFAIGRWDLDTQIMQWLTR